MGFGFNLFFIFTVVPLTIILLTAGVATKKKIYGKAIGFIWFGIVGLILISTTFHALMAKKVLKKDDYYGQYVIDTRFFPGKQADWQYDNFRFEINDKDSIYLYVTNKDKIVSTFKGTVTTLRPYRSEVLIVNMEQPEHHIFEYNPTIYRTAWSFYLVFDSPNLEICFLKGDNGIQGNSVPDLRDSVMG